MSTAELLAAKGPKPDSWWTWAAVTALSPLRVKLDGEDAPLPATPGTVVGLLAVTDRVWVQVAGGRLLIIGRAGGVASASNPNLIINGDFRINQRGYVSGTALTSAAYGFDRWCAVDTNSVMTFTAAPQGQAVTLSAVSTWTQLVERANAPAGAYTLSWKGTAQGLVVKDGSASSWHTSPYTYTSDGTGNLRVQFGPGTVSDVKLEQGSTATPFQTTDYGEELRKCWRYFQKLTSASTFAVFAQGFQISTTVGYALANLPVAMRATPTLTWGSLLWSDTGFNSTISALTINALPAASASTYSVSATFTTGGATSRPGFVLSSAANGFIALDAEL